MSSSSLSRKRALVPGLIAVGVMGAAFVSRGITQSPNDFHFALLGDRTGGPEFQIFGRVMREIDLLHPDFMLTVGDTIEGRKDETAEKQWEELRPVWEKYKHYPIYFTAGNHDYWSEFSRKLYEKETGRAVYYSFDYQNMHFTVLDNSNENELNAGQLEFLEKDLAANVSKQPKLVVFHRPYWIGALQKQGTDFPLHKIVKKYGVDHVISGHGHQFVRIVREGVQYMEVGSSGGTMRGKLLRGEGFKEGVFYHYVWVHVQGGKAYMTVKELSGGGGQGRMFRTEDWDENGPKFDISDPALTEKPTT